MKLSHSKLSTILSCPASYYLRYIQGISTIVEKPALSIGSAVHWGIEHNSEDLTEYFNSEESAYTRDQLLSEAMVHGYLKKKDLLFDQILSNNDEKLTLIEESHEIYLNAKLGDNDFVGIVDLLLLTDQGFVIIDYKTSSSTPDWNNYLDQIYRYIFLVNSEFPDIPVIKIGIINLRKTGIRQKKTENWYEFLNRLKWEYETSTDEYIAYHEYPVSSLSKEYIEDYIKNLDIMCKTAEVIDKEKLFFINYGAAIGMYGKSEFWDIFYKTPDAHLLYKISDKYLVDGELNDVRPCNPTDMLVLDNKRVLNHYTDFHQEITEFNDDISNFMDYLNKKYVFDKDLIDNYREIFSKNL